MRHRKAERHDQRQAEREARELANHGSIIHLAYGYVQSPVIGEIGVKISRAVVEVRAVGTPLSFAAWQAAGYDGTSIDPGKAAGR